MPGNWAKVLSTRGAVLRAVALAAAVLAADDERDVDEAAGHVVHLGRLVEDLVGADQEEVHIHEFDDRAQADHGRTDGHAHKALLADRGVDHAALAELVHQVAGHAEEAAVGADVFADHVDALIALHLFADGFVNRLDVSSLAHGCVSWSRP